MTVASKAFGRDCGRISHERHSIAEIGLLSSVQAVYPLLEDRGAATERLADAFRIEVGGLGLDELVGGLGVAQATLTGLEMLGLGGPDRVVVQGSSPRPGCGSSASRTCATWW